MASGSLSDRKEGYRLPLSNLRGQIGGKVRSKQTGQN